MVRIAPSNSRPTQSKADAAAEGLVYVSDDEPGYRRYRRGKGFIYVDPRDHRVTRPAELMRIRRLAIPPAYVDVWICRNPRGHLQATGRDARGRKQYRYHKRWRRVRDRGKFAHMSDFGKALPRIRRRVRADLSLSGWPRQKVLALLVRLLDQTLVRVGNESYASANGSFGLTTLRARHVKAERRRLQLSFRAKGGKRSDIVLTDQRLVSLVRRIQQLPSQRLFQYLGDDGTRHPVDSDMVNDYLREIGGDDFTAKDFRTWSATVRAIGLFAHLTHDEDERSRQETVRQVVAEVAGLLRNTPSVCRASYIHPRAIAGWEDGSLQRFILPAGLAAPRKLERAVLRFLRSR